MYKKQLKKILYFIPNYILILLNLIYYPLYIKYMNIETVDFIAPFEKHDKLGRIIGLVSIICIILRFIFNAKRCNIESKAYKIINNILTILLLIILFLLWTITGVA